MIETKKATYRKSVCKRLERITADEFTTPTLITLHCSSAVGMSHPLAKKVFSSWKYQARRIAGRPFKFIKIFDCGPHPIPGIVFYVIADLPENICRETCGAWYMGKATVERMSPSVFNKIADSIMRQDSKPDGVHPRQWSYCAQGFRSSATPLAQ